MNVLKEQMEINIADHMERCEHIEKKMGKFLRNRHWELVEDYKYISRKERMQAEAEELEKLQDIEDERYGLDK